MKEPASPRPPKDQLEHRITLEVSGTSLEHMMEFARQEGARIFNVPSKRVKVHLSTPRVAARDPFVQHLGVYARPALLGCHATCILVPDPDMPTHDSLP